MTASLPRQVLDLARNRRALLWVCQRYSLLPGEEPHQWDESAADSALIYRTEIDETDKLIASLFWEAVWMDAAKSPLHEAIKENAQNEDATQTRTIIELAGKADARVEITSDKFLPIWSLPGLMDGNRSHDAKYGGMGLRARERLAFDFASRLNDYQNRALFVLGASKNTDLEFLFDVLEELPLFNFHVIVVWPSGLSAPPPINNAGVKVHLFLFGESRLAELLQREGIPQQSDALTWTIRIGTKSVELSSLDEHNIHEQFYLLTEKDLTPPDSFSLEDFLSFLRGDIESWAGYAVNAVVDRSYRSQSGKTLQEEVLTALAALSSPELNSQLSGIVFFQSEPGAGATTLLRSAAFCAAQKGHPCLIFRPDQIDVDIERLESFATSLHQLCLAEELDDLLPIVVLFDEEHFDIVNARLIASSLASQGRKVLVIQGIPVIQQEEGNDNKEVRSKTYCRLSPLTSTVTSEEVTSCENVFTTIVKRFQIPLEIPAANEWEQYGRSTWVTPDGEERMGVTFWVALQFFLTHQLDDISSGDIRGALGAWIESRFNAVDDPSDQRIIDYIACLSSFRIISPVWTILRPVTGGKFTSNLVTLLGQLDSIVEWAPSKSLGDQTLRFTHPSLANEHLRRRSITSSEDKMNVLSPVLTLLTTGHPADRWLSNRLAYQVLAPSHVEMRSFPNSEWDWRLAAFHEFPSILADQSRTILHHWARCLYLSTESYECELIVDKEKRFLDAISKLDAAILLPIQKGRDEHQSHLYNTLGVALSRYSSFLETQGRPKSEIEETWAKSTTSFQKAIACSGGANVEAILAFSRRLISHVSNQTENNSNAKVKQLEEISLAISLLDELQELLDSSYVPDNSLQVSHDEYLTEALNWLDGNAASEFVTDLKEKNPSVGYFCEARLLLGFSFAPQNVAAVLDLFEAARNADVDLGPRPLLLYLSIMRNDTEKQFDFTEQLSVVKSLKAHPDYIPRSIDYFREAVLLYQAGEYKEGANVFKHIRKQTRMGNITPARISDKLRNPNDPTNARLVSLRVGRKITEWKAEGYVSEIDQHIPFKPRHFSPMPNENDVIPCVIRFVFNGPTAVPPRFEGIGH